MLSDLTREQYQSAEQLMLRIVKDNQPIRIDRLADELRKRVTADQGKPPVDFVESVLWVRGIGAGKLRLSDDYQITLR